jgi:hypothetical protein
MLQIRRDIFETNSSSVHAMTICTKDEYEKFMNGELYWDSRGDKLMTKEEILAREMKESWNAGIDPEELFRSLVEEREYKTYENFDYDFESFEYHHTTPSGDQIVAFGYSGYDG